MENRSNARTSSSSSLSAPRSLFLHAPVRKSSSILSHPKTQMKKMRITPVVHVIRIHAIYEKSRAVLAGLGGLFAVQVVVMAICCGFYRCEQNLYLALSMLGKLTLPRLSQLFLSLRARVASLVQSTTGSVSTGWRRPSCTPLP